MSSDDLTREQCEVLKAKVGPMLRYLGLLHGRMVKRKFVPSDPLLLRWRSEKQDARPTR